MVAPLNSLANMEMMLYGGTGLGFSPNCPSLINGYCASSSAYPMVNPQIYNTMKDLAFKGVQKTKQAYEQSMQTASDYLKQAKQDTSQYVNEVADYVSKNNVVEESFTGALTGGLTFAAMENMLSVLHPINSYNAMRDTDKIFKELMEKNPQLRELWKTDKRLMQRAYNQLYTANRNAQSKWFFSKWFQKPITAGELADLQNRMTTALKSGNPDLIRRASEELQAARGMNGRIPTLIDKIMGKSPKTCAQRIAEKSLPGKDGGLSTIEKSIVEQRELADLYKGSLAGKGAAFAKNVFKEGKGWFLFDMAFSLPKIFTAFKDGGVESGIAQTGQSALKAAGNAVGWGIGRTIGGAIGAKAGAALGTAVCPGLGTAAGAIIGFIGGCVGSWAVNKLTNWLIPENKEEASLIAMNKMKTTPDGQVQLLQKVAQDVESGKRVPDRVIFAAQNMAQGLG